MKFLVMESVVAFKGSIQFVVFVVNANGTRFMIKHSESVEYHVIRNVSSISPN